MSFAELYQELILDHNKRPRNFRVLEHATAQVDGNNPLCGDQVTVYVTVQGGVIAEVAFQGHGCAISTASASMMTEFLTGKTVAEAEAVFAQFHALVTGEPHHGPVELDLGKLEAFAGVSEFPARVKCASLAWHTLMAALAGAREPVTTE